MDLLRVSFLAMTHALVVLAQVLATEEEALLGGLSAKLFFNGLGDAVSVSHPVSHVT